MNRDRWEVLSEYWQNDQPLVRNLRHNFGYNEGINWWCCLKNCSHLNYFMCNGLVSEKRNAPLVTEAHRARAYVGRALTDAWEGENGWIW